MNPTSQSLARQYRPQTLSELVGQEHVIKALEYGFSKNKTHPAYLFTGTRGVGKTTLSRIIAKSLNCEQGISASPCLVCSTCKAISDGSYVDLIEIDAASNTGVDDVRVLIENASYAPTQGRFKVYVLDEVHMLSKSAFNALLKTLEEPPAFIQFVLATTDPQKIPVTVLSRCLQFHLKSLTVEQISQRLIWILEQQNIQFDQESIQLLAQAGQGSMRDALSLLDQVIAFMAGKPLSGKEISQFLGIVGHEQILNLLHGIISQNMQNVHDIAKEMQMANQSFIQATEQIAIAWQNMGLLQHGLDDESWTPTWKTGLQNLMKNLTLPQMIQGYKTAVEVRKHMPDAPNLFTGFCMGMMMLMNDIVEVLSSSNFNSVPVKIENKERVENSNNLNISSSVPIIRQNILREAKVNENLSEVKQKVEQSEQIKVNQIKTAEKTEVIANNNINSNSPIQGLKDLIDIASQTPMNPIRHMVLEHAQWLKCEEQSGQITFHIRTKNMPMASMTSKLSERITKLYPQLGMIKFAWQQGEPEGMTISQQVKKNENDAYEQQMQNATELPLIQELQHRFHAKVVHVQNIQKI